MTYLTVSEANDYFATRLNSNTWECAETYDQIKALSMASRAINRLAFIGVKTDTLQELAFPRDGATTVPDDIKIACCEIAIKLLDGVNVDYEMDSLSVTSNNISPVKETFDRTIVNHAIRAGIPSQVAWTHLLPYLKDPFTFTLTRT